MLRIIYILCCCAFVSVSNAQEAELSVLETEDLKYKVSTQAKHSKTIVNTFVQLKHISFLSNAIESSGELYFRAPNTIKWSYATPYEYSVIFKEKKLYINDAGKKSNINLGGSKLFKKLNDLIAKSVSGAMLDEHQFEMSFYKNENVYIANLSPKDSTLQSMFKHIILTFDKQNYLVTSVRLIEPSEDYTLINFVNKSINQPIPDAIFMH